MPSGSSANGTRVQLYDCNGGTNQQWDFWSDGTVRPAFNRTKCLDLPGWQTANQTPIQIWDCNNGSNQQWTLGSDGSLRGYGGKCVDDPGGSTANGSTLQYYDCGGGTNQEFALAPAVSADVVARWQDFGGPSGFLGLPTTAEQPWGNGTITYFENGYIAAFNGTDTVVEIGGNEIVFQIKHIDSGTMHLMQPLTLTVFSNGGSQLSGLFYDNAYWPVKVSFGLLWKAGDGTPFAFTHSSGDLWFGSPWENSETAWVNSATNASVAADWNNFINGWSYSWRASDSADVSGILSGLSSALGAGSSLIQVIK